MAAWRGTFGATTTGERAFRTEDEALSYAKAQAGNATKAAAFKALLRTPDKAFDTGTVGDPTKGFAQPPGDPYPITPFYFNLRGTVRDKDATGNPIGDKYEEPREANMLKYSLSNPQAPLGTIITHCAFHRLNTAKNTISPAASQLYAKNDGLSENDFDAVGSDGTGARDIILRLDGTARSYDVSKWNNPAFPTANHGSNWQNSDF